MLTSFSELEIRRLLDQYPAVSVSSSVALHGHLGGFSGASLWRVETFPHVFCLRLWPLSGPRREQLRWLHKLIQQARSNGLSFVPVVYPARAGTTFLEYRGRLWELVSWMPGCADFHQYPSRCRLQAVCTALAEVHQVWQSLETHRGPCPAVLRRLQRAQDWLHLVQTGWQPHFTSDVFDPVNPWSKSAWPLLLRWMEHVPSTLAPWREQLFSLQPCWCDLWHDHVLYQGERLSGLIDYGNARIDHVAVDLARLLGSMLGDERAEWGIALEAYARVRSLTPSEVELAHVLDRTGTLLSAANWLRWLYHERRPLVDRTRVAQRLAVLVERMEHWQNLIEL